MRSKPTWNSFIVLSALALCLSLAACGSTDLTRSGKAPETTVLADQGAPEIPEKLSRNEQGIPLLKVYDVQEKKTLEMDAEEYLCGVLAGEMRNDWPLEALKAQAILARTFVMLFVGEKKSQYDGADISTNVSEAQAYSAASVNDRIRQAVRETRGLVASVDGKLVRAWFHSHSGGMTEVPSVGLDYRGGDPDYLKPVRSEESPDAPEEVQRWTASFSAAEVGEACAKAGAAIGEARTVQIEGRGESGRVKTFSVNGKSVSAPDLRINLGPSKLKSTLIDSVRVEGDQVIFSGRGYGHGVGMSQWGAYAMAKAGSDAQEIVRHYFDGVEITRMWA